MSGTAGQVIRLGPFGNIPVRMFPDSPGRTFTEIQFMFRFLGSVPVESESFAKGMLNSMVKFIVEDWENQNGPADLPISELYSSRLTGMRRVMFVRQICPFEGAALAMRNCLMEGMIRDDLHDVAELKFALRRFVERGSAAPAAAGEDECEE